METKIELIEILDPPQDAMVRQFHCNLCNKTHLKTGRIARIWVNWPNEYDGYASQAALDCYKREVGLQ